jgi:hypothetical protein
MRGVVKVAALRRPASSRIGIAALVFGALWLTFGSALAMSVPEVIKLLDAGVGESVILDQIRVANAGFELSTQDILDLKEAGASDTLIQAMIRTADLEQGDEGTVGGSQGTSSRDGSTTDWRSAYSVYPDTRLSVYYDPFGYQWCAWPYYFGYYYPFSWGDCGFYHAGFSNHRWWRYGSWVDHHWSQYHWDRTPPGANGRHAWDRRSRNSVGGWGRAVSGGQGRRLGTPAPRGGQRNDASPSGSDPRSDRRTGRGAWGRTSVPREPARVSPPPSSATPPSRVPAGNAGGSGASPTPEREHTNSGRHAFGR